MKGMILMYGHKWKIVGAVISLICIAAMVIEKTAGFVLFKGLSKEQHYFILEWVLLLGLVTIIYSKEKYDDERVQMIRLRSFQYSFAIMMSLIMSIALTGALSPDSVGVQPGTLFRIGAMGVTLYLVLFYIFIYIDIVSDRLFPRGKHENILREIIFSIGLYLILCFISVLIFLFL